MKKVFWFAQVLMMCHFSSFAQRERAGHDQVVPVNDSTIDAPLSGVVVMNLCLSIFLLQ